MITAKKKTVWMDPVCCIGTGAEVQNWSSPSFQVRDSEAVCGVQAHAAVPHHAAQQRPQLRWDPVQRHLGGHVIHGIRSEESAERETQAAQKCRHVVYHNRRTKHRTWAGITWVARPFLSFPHTMEKLRAQIGFLFNEFGFIKVETRHQWTV